MLVSPWRWDLRTVSRWLERRRCWLNRHPTDKLGKRLGVSHCVEFQDLEGDMPSAGREGWRPPVSMGDMDAREDETSTLRKRTSMWCAWYWSPSPQRPAAKRNLMRLQGQNAGTAQRRLHRSDWRASRRQTRRLSCFEGRLFMLCQARELVRPLACPMTVNWRAMPCCLWSPQQIFRYPLLAL